MLLINSNKYIELNLIPLPITNNIRIPIIKDTILKNTFAIVVLYITCPSFLSG